ncbi:DUF5977 domain-containing protein [Flavobacterium sp. N502540]|uniref:DUF5977 domain-containing protein n=1 Tax=Flavobacterium sp. N502540 TaxID=2986838 RepID=UPI002225040A|nr:DUF5977 domain-containing protein [Flavobacterium sp. N502540]
MIYQFLETTEQPSGQYSNPQTLDFIIYPGHYTMDIRNIEGITSSITASWSKKTFVTQRKGGGVRIQKIMNFDSNNSIIGVKKFLYNNTNGSTTGKLIEPLIYDFPIFATDYTRHDDEWPGGQAGLDGSLGYYTYIYRVRMSNSTSASNLVQNPGVVGYDRVIELDGENGENGRTEYYYHNIEDVLPSRILPYIPLIHNPKNGKVSKIIYFNAVGDSIKKNEYQYTLKDTKYIQGLTKETMYPEARRPNPSPYYVNTSILRYYNIPSYWIVSSEEIETLFNRGQNGTTVTKRFYYDNYIHLNLTKSELVLSEGKIKGTKYIYARDSEASNLPFVSEMINSNMISIPLKKQIFNENDILSEQLTVYDKSTSTSNLLLPKAIYAAKFTNGLLNIPNIGNLEKKITYDQYDDKGNILQYTPESGVSTSIIWGYNKTQPIAKIENASYSSIPAGTITNLQELSNADTDNCMSESCTEQLFRNALNTLRNSLPNAFITTYTYNPLVGVTSITDPKGVPSYYEYDSFGRLKFIKDQDLNVLQKYCYNYKGQQTDCSDNTSTTEYFYKSAARTGSFTRNNCPVGGTGQSVSYSQDVGAYISTISQADAESKGLDKFNTEGQIYANANGGCTFYSAAISQSITKNNCATGGVGSSVVYSQPYGTMSSNSSQADADDKGLIKFNTDGQNYANTNGTCTFSSVSITGNFIKNNCVAGGVGQVVSYTLPAGSKTSTVSQADADSQAVALFNTNGEVNANTVGVCTFSSASITGTFTKNSCPGGGVPQVVSYTLWAGAKTSTVSQADADSQAAILFNINGQANANAVGTCTFSSISMTGTFTKNNCPVGGVGQVVSYTLPAGSKTSTVSQADADWQALALFNTNGQASANATIICTFYNKAKSKSFVQKKCPKKGSITRTVPAGKYSSKISQQDADAKAQKEIDEFGEDVAKSKC